MRFDGKHHDGYQAPVEQLGAYDPQLFALFGFMRRIVYRDCASQYR